MISGAKPKPILFSSIGIGGIFGALNFEIDCQYRNIYLSIQIQDYNEYVKKMPLDIDWTKLADYEQEDNTVSMQTLACTADSCEIVDIA